MNLIDIYRSTPTPVKTHIRRLYDHWRDVRSRHYIRKDYMPTFFGSNAEFEEYKNEFESSAVMNIYEEGLTTHLESVDTAIFGSIRPTVGKQYYALIRSLKPTVVVETGVCNGFSTLCILHALSKNDSGHLYSIDYPYYADEELSEFRAETFTKFGGEAIPSDKSPGWIIPEELRSRWTLRIGKSQRELPQLVTTLEKIDLFIHDSEHSKPCMLYELELAWEWLSDDGVIVVDDIDWNDAFDVFRNVRDANAGRLNIDTGYLIKE